MTNLYMSKYKGMQRCWQVIAQFLAAKAKADSAGSDATPEAANSLIEALHSLTSVRAVLAGGLSSGELLSCSFSGMPSLRLSTAGLQH